MPGRGARRADVLRGEGLPTGEPAELSRRCDVPPGLAGPVIVASPNPISNRDFSRKLATALHRPLLLRMPTSMVKLAFGQMANETILASHRALPAKLISTDFPFRHPTLDQALHDLLPRK